MMKAPKIVILPGLDGTGELLTDFAASLERRHPVEIIVYPARKLLGYDALFEYVKEQLPSEDFVLIGESFSGPLAIRVAWTNPPNLKAVVLGASFARLDLPFKRLLAILATYLPVNAMPTTLLNIALMNGRATAAQRNLLKQTLRGLEQDIIAFRAKEALRVDLTRSDAVMSQPTLYLRATADRLIPANAPDIIAGLATKLVIRDIPAPHFMFQIDAGVCAEAIFDFIASL